MLKRIFDFGMQRCKHYGVDQRDAVAIKLLAASKTIDDEAALIAVVKDAIASYRSK